MAEDVGFAGSYSPNIIGEGSLNELRNLAGPAPADGKHWVMVDLKTGELKWYKRRASRGGSSPRRRR